MANSAPRTPTKTAAALVRRTEPLPESWTKAAGLLRHQRRALAQHLKRVRTEWDDRTARS